MKFRGRRNFIKSSAPNGETEDGEKADELQLAPPALQLKAENDGSSSSAEISAPFQLQDDEGSTKTTKAKPFSVADKTAETADPVKEKEKEKFEVSKGFMQLGIEGFMDGKSHDVRRPHMPENLAVFKPATKEEKANKAVQKYTKDQNDRFKASGSGTFLRSAKKSIYNDASYSEDIPDGHILGTYPNNSGLTIGYGYDLGSREKDDVKKRLVNAGISESDASSLSEAAGLKGVKAAKITSQLRNTGMMITKDQALKLLDLTLPEYEDGIDMENLHPVVTEVLVYLTYWRGPSGSKKYKKAITDACSGKDKSAQIAATKEIVVGWSGEGKSNKEKSWNEQVFSRFTNILGELGVQQDAGKEIVVSEKVKTKDELLSDSDKTSELLEESVGVKLDDHLKKKLLIVKNVGFGSPNEKGDVQKVMSRLVINKTITAEQYAAVVGSQDEATIGSYIQKYQKTFWKGADGIVSVGGNTEQKLIAIKAPATDTPERTPAKEKEETDDKEPEKESGLDEIYQLYDSGEIDLQEMSVMLKPFCTSEPGAVLGIFAKLWYYQRDNLAYSIADQSTNNELATFDTAVLAKMSAELGGKMNTVNWAENQKMQLRVDAVRAVKKAPKKVPKEDDKKEEEKAEDQYTIHDANAIIRDSKGDPKEGSPKIARWTKVTLLETKEVLPSGKTKNLTIGKVKYQESGASVENWTSMGNLYAQFWNPQDHSEEYGKVDEGYKEAMEKVDTEKTRAAAIMSGSGVKAVCDQFYPNSTNVADLGSTFGGKLQKFMDFLGENDMSASITAGLRHPLRSLVFDSAIKAAKGGNNLQIAQAQSIKYGLPIDWLHYKEDGTIDEAKSKSKAVVVKGEFGIGSKAARGVKDELGGRFSNHNFGNAADMRITFGFKEKVVEKNGNKYNINAASETPTSTKKGAYLKNCGSKPLAQLGLKEFGVTRTLDDDAIHWSATGG